MLQSYLTTFKDTIKTKMQSLNHNLLTQTRTFVVFGWKVANLNETEDDKHEPILFFYLRLLFELGSGFVWITCSMGGFKRVGQQKKATSNGGNQ